MNMTWNTIMSFFRGRKGRWSLKIERFIIMNSIPLDFIGGYQDRIFGLNGPIKFDDTKRLCCHSSFVAVVISLWLYVIDIIA